MTEHPRLTRRHGLRAVLAVAAALPAAAAVTTTVATPAGAATSGRGGRLHVMTFNLRYASDTSPHSWADRRPVMRELLRKERPHVIGTQEGLYHQLQDIHDDLGEHYAWIGTGRAGGSRDEFGTVFYDTRRLRPVEFDHFWLSDTPELIGSKSWGNSVIRMATWVRFADLTEGGKEFYLLNTHFDHQVQVSRVKSAELIASRIAALDKSLPLLMTGDFNVAAHGNPVYDQLLATGLKDTWDAAAQRSKLYATFHGYKPLVPDGDRIDWILATPGVTVHSASINTYAKNGQFPSDHLPVQVRLTLG
ncbi:endonuclease/exonuclease/phosphatase family protein [Streptomyces sp. NPDC102340]|uniref:endonuclease/exonuclease/phosphatase family protein n=1 Tax=unclassified Streptomyces TaxID=2593676 RepID=UPI00380777AB